MRIILLILISQLQLQAQGYTSWIVGDTANATPTNFQAGIVLAGGGGDNDDAMQWMLQRADGGDVLVIRASGSNGYNNYFFQDLGVDVNSVETIRFNTIAASTDPYVLRRLGEAEVIFMAGGDQYDYYQLWRNTPVEDTLNYLINDKGVTVGGTSAGMAILGRVYYTPSAGSLDPDDALANPFHPNVDIIGKDDFLNAPFLENLITDTHYDERERAGRHVTFLARMLHDFGGERAYGIACNEYTAVAIDENGIARVFGEYPEYPEYAYFLRSNCQEEYAAEVLAANTPLTWNRTQSAVKAYKVPGTVDGSNFVDLNDDWSIHQGGEWQNWYVEDGELFKIPNTNGDCADMLIVGVEGPSPAIAVKVSPNPFSRWLTLQISPFSADMADVRLYNLLGQLVLVQRMSSNQISLDLEGLAAGGYWLRVGEIGVGVWKM